MATGAREANAMRALKYVGLGIAGLVVLAVAAFFVAPHVIDWNSRKGEIAEQLAAATGKELKIDGDISVAWTTTATFRIDGIRLVDNYDGKSIDVVAIERVSGEVALIPLLSGRLEVLDLAIVKPTFDLRVVRSGRANWAAEAGEARAGGRKADDGDDEGLPVDDIIIRNLSVSDGALAFANRASGQKIAASAIGLALKMPSLDNPLTLDGEMTLNGEPVTLKTTVNAPRGLLEGPGAAIDFGFETTHARSGFAGKVVKGEVTGVDGTLMLDLPSVAKLAAWLGRPLAKGQPDPGAVNLKAVFKSDGAVVTLQKATILGKALNVEATGSIDAGKTTKVVRLKVTSGVLDIDRYLPPPAKTGGSKPARKTGMSASPFAALSDEPFELAALKTLDAEIDIDIGGVKARQLKLGKTVATIRAKDGKVTSKVKAKGFLGGSIDGELRLNGAGGDLVLDLGVSLAKVNAGPLSQMGGGEKTLGGKLNMTLALKAKGKSPRALAQAATGKLALAVGRVLAKGVPPISKVKLNIDAPGIDRSPSLTGSLILNKEKVTLAATLDPLATVLFGKAFKAKLDLAAKRLKLGYDGKVKGGEAPSLDGTLVLSVPSVRGLARWLGNPLPKGQRDPGPLDLKAVFKGQGTKVTLESAAILGKALDLKAKGSFDGGKKVKVVRLEVKSGMLDLDRYLPAPAKPAKGAKKARAKGGNPLDALSAEPIDLAALKALDAEIDIDMGGVKARQLKLGKTAVQIRAKGGKATAKIVARGFFGGKVDGDMALDGTAKALGVDLKLALSKVKAKPFSRTFMPMMPLGGVLGLDVDLKTKGESPRALARNAVGALALEIGRIMAPGVPPLSKLALKLNAPGLDEKPSLDASLIFNKEPVSLKLGLDPLSKVLSGKAFQAKLDLTSKPLTLGFDGKVKGGDKPALDGKLGLDIASVGKLAAWVGAPLPKGQPDPGKLRLRAQFASEGTTTVLKSASIDGKALKATASGRFVAQKVPRIEAKIDLVNADIDAYLPPEKKAKKKAAKRKSRGWSKEPIHFAVLRQANGIVDVTVGKLRYKGLDITKTKVKAKLQKGVMTLKVANAEVSGGRLSLDATLDGSKKPARLAYKASGANLAARGRC